jgi:methyltransferase (TIGR00027 family)
MNKIPITADSLMALRADPKLCAEIGVSDPYAPYFVTDAGRAMCQKITSALEAIYPHYNLARYYYFQHHIETHNFEQLLVLGAGYDTRPYLMAKFQTGRIPVFEVDFPEKLISKRQRLQEVGKPIPDWIHPVESDLANPDLPQRLVASGYNPTLKTLVVMEGVSFFLPPPVSETLLDPKFLTLSKGSSVIADIWTPERVNELNRIASIELGQALFNTGVALPEKIAERFNSVTMSPLDDITQRAYGVDESTALSKGWSVVEAKVD